MLAVIAAGHAPALAGASYDLDTKALHAQAIVEVEISVLPKSSGWEASNRRAKDRKVLRTIFKTPDFDSPKRIPPYFPFSLSSRCWAGIKAEKRIRVLAFYPEETVAGLEEDAGAYTSLNADYDGVVEAIATVAEWRRASKTENSARSHLAIVMKTPNPYLRFIGAHFAKEYDDSSDPGIDAIIKGAPPSVSYPVAECDRPRKGAG
jgi:hypothetical protein